MVFKLSELLCNFVVILNTKKDFFLENVAKFGKVAGSYELLLESKHLFKPLANPLNALSDFLDIGIFKLQLCLQVLKIFLQLRFILDRDTPRVVQNQ